MLKFSTNSLNFYELQTEKYFTIINQLDKSCVYMIHTNNLQAIEVIPNCGFIKYNTTVNVQVRKKYSQSQKKQNLLQGSVSVFNSLIIKEESEDNNEGDSKTGDNESVFSQRREDKENIKLKILWVDLGDEFEGFEFKDIWEKFRELKKQSFIMKIKFIKKKKQMSVQKVGHHKMQESKQKKKVVNNEQKNQQKQEQNNNEKSISSHLNIGFSLIKDIQELEENLLQQISETKKLKQRINITEEKLREINQERLQIKVHKAIGIQCPEKHKTFSELLVYGLSFFLLGYFYQRWTVQ